MSNTSSKYEDRNLMTYHIYLYIIYRFFTGHPTSIPSQLDAGTLQDGSYPSRGRRGKG